MSEKTVLRILKELQDIQRNPESQFYLAFDEDNVTKNVQALIMGTPETPYAYGMFTFRFTFPSNYPTDSPKVVGETTNGNRTRFNPNALGEAKQVNPGALVCGPSEFACSPMLTGHDCFLLNINGSAHGIWSVLISIQSLMGERPFHNEPGYEKVKTHGRDMTKEIEEYNLKIMHETIRVSVCDRLEGYLSNRKHVDRAFEDVAKWLFMAYYRHYLDIIATETQKVAHDSKFTRMPFEAPGNQMDGRFDYPSLDNRLKAIYREINEETSLWIRHSKDWTEESSLTHGNLSGQFGQIDSSGEFGGQMHLELEDNNPFVWAISIFGQHGTNYEGGVFRVRMVFHNDFPSKRPRVCFTTPFFHPCVSEDGIPYFRVERMDDVKSHLRVLMQFFTQNPSSDPTTHLNRKAAQMYFGSKEEHKEYGRMARRCSDRSHEYL